MHTLVVKHGGTSNDNRELDAAGLDPDRHYVRDYMAKACAHFKERRIDRELIAEAMLNELFRMLEGNPFRSPADEGALRSDQQFLWGMKHRIVPMSEQWDKGWIRAQYEKRPTYQFNRACRGPAPKLPRRLIMPLPDVNLSDFLATLRLLRLRRGYPYTEKEIDARYRRRVAAVTRRTPVNKERLRKLKNARDGLADFFKKNRHLATVQDQD